MATTKLVTAGTVRVASPLVSTNDSDPTLSLPTGVPGGVPVIAAKVDLAGQTASVDFDLVADPSGLYAFLDYLTILSLGVGSSLLYTLTWRDEGGPRTLAQTCNAIGSGSLLGTVLSAFGNLTLPPQTLFAVSGTPVHVSLEAQGADGIATASVTAGAAGTGYAIGDTGQVTTGDTAADYQVLTVDGGGGVLTFSVTSPGSLFTISTGNATSVTTGAGDGTFEVDITALTAADILFAYHVSLEQV